MEAQVSNRVRTRRVLLAAPFICIFSIAFAFFAPDIFAFFDEYSLLVGLLAIGGLYIAERHQKRMRRERGLPGPWAKRAGAAMLALMALVFAISYWYFHGWRWPAA